MGKGVRERAGQKRGSTCDQEEGWGESFRFRFEIERNLARVRERERDLEIKIFRKRDLERERWGDGGCIR